MGDRTKAMFVFLFRHSFGVLQNWLHFYQGFRYAPRPAYVLSALRAFAERFKSYKLANSRIPLSE